MASMNQMYMQLMSLRVSRWSSNHLSLPQDRRTDLAPLTCQLTRLPLVPLPCAECAVLRACPYQCVTSLAAGLAGVIKTNSQIGKKKKKLLEFGSKPLCQCPAWHARAARAADPSHLVKSMPCCRCIVCSCSTTSPCPSFSYH